MTFEEFLKKKKIDPVQLQAAERDLFRTFERDFDQMGDKSFEYSKKFWFNKLRRAHPLKEEPKPLKNEETSPASTPAESPKSAEAITETTATANSKPAFKPRFKAQLASAKIEESTDKEESPNPVAVPAFKPRFRAPAPPVKEEEKVAEEVKTESVAKPIGFKPRFKASASPASTKSTSEEKINEGTAEPAQSIVKEVQTKADIETAQTESKPDEELVAKPAYKPRFKPSMVKKDPEE